MTALSALDRPAVLIRASAGTGKTYALSGRFISLLARHESPERILATTFTRKAAAEIQQRIFLRLAEAALDEKTGSLLGKDLNDGSFNSQSAAGLLCALVKQQHRLNICTLDSLFIRIARSFALELGLMPDWKIADEYADAELKTGAIHAVCSGAAFGKLAALVRLLAGGGAKRSIQKKLESDVAALHALFREAPAEAWNCIREAKPPAGPHFSELLSELKTLPVPCGQNQKPDKRWQKAILAAHECLKNDDWTGFLGQGLAAAITDNKDTYCDKEIPPAFYELFKSVIEHAFAACLNELRRQTLATYELLTMYDRHFERLRTASNMLSFNDVKFRLAQAAISGDLQELYYRLDCRISHLLLDEFQDTSTQEWRVLEPVADEILAESGESKCSFFCVGDTKQAIYGWRGGVAEIFDSLENKWRQLEPLHTQESRRSSTAVINAVNQVFGSIGSNPEFGDHKEAAQKWQPRFFPHTTVRSNCPGYAALMTAIPGSEEQDSSHAVLDKTAKLVKEINQAAPHLSLGVLVRRNQTVARIIFELGKEAYSISASEEGGNPLTDSAAVMLILSLLTLADHPGDSAARFHAANSPLGAAVGLAADATEQQCAGMALRIRSQLLNSGYGEVLNNWTKALQPFCSVREQRRLRQLVEIGLSFDAARELRPGKFVSLISSLKVEDPNASNVRVMTIHQAKGLEFDAVILPELDFRLLDFHFEPVMAYRPDPLMPPQRIVRAPPKELRKLEPQFEQMYNKQQEERLKEALSVLYVAMTRAKHALYMLVQAPARASASGPTYAGILRHALAGEGGVAHEECLFEEGDPSWFKRIEPEAPSGQSEALAPDVSCGQISLYEPPIEPGRQRVRGLIHRTPSELEGGPLIDLKRLMQLNDGLSARRGLALHRLLSLIEWADSNLPSAEQMRGALQRMDLSGLDIDKLLEEFSSLLQVKEIAALLSKERYAHFAAERLEVYRESPFAFREQDTIFNGAFDRLVVCYARKRAFAAEVIDFKTDQFDAQDGAMLESKIDFYRPQLEVYRRAGAVFASVPETEVSVRIVFTSLPKVCLLSK